MEIKKPSLWACNFLYMMAAVCLVGFPFLLRMFFSVLRIKYMGTYYTQALITEFLAILLPGLLYLLYRKMDIRRVIRFKPLPWSQFFIITGLSFSGYIIIIFCNFIWIWILTALGGKVVTPVIPTMNTPLDVLMGILVIGGSAALAEEFLFRGIILRGYEHFGSKTAILSSGILFGILHMKTQSVMATVFLGILIGYLAYKTGSILASMIYHFFNNVIAILLTWMATWVAEISKKAGSIPPVTMSAIPLQTKVVTFGVLGFFAIGALAIFIGLLVLLHNLTKRDQEKDESVMKGKAPFLWWQFIPLAIGLTIVVGMYAQDLVKIFR